MPKIPGQI